MSWYQSTLTFSRLSTLPATVCITSMQWTSTIVPTTSLAAPCTMHGHQVWFLVVVGSLIIFSQNVKDLECVNPPINCRNSRNYQKSSPLPTHALYQKETIPNLQSHCQRMREVQRLQFGPGCCSWRRRLLLTPLQLFLFPFFFFFPPCSN